MAIPGAATSHVRHRTRDALTTHFLESGYDVRAVRGLLDHKDGKMTTLYVTRLNRGGMGVGAP